MSETLKPCPFCGGEAHTYKNNLWHVACERAYNGCVTMSAFITESEAVEAWNTRTPEQAIAATFGGIGSEVGSEVCGKLTAEQVHKIVDRNCEWYEGGDIDAQAIVDELNAALDGGECEFVIEDNMNESEGMGDVWFRCTNCDTTFDYYADDWLMKQNYCPHCGFKIRKAVKR